MTDCTPETLPIFVKLMTSAVCSDGVNQRLRKKSRVVRPDTPMARSRVSFSLARSIGGRFHTASRTSVSSVTTRLAPMETEPMAVLIAKLPAKLAADALSSSGRSTGFDVYGSMPSCLAQSRRALL